MVLGYFSIIVDAGGGSGCTHLPRFRNTEKSEPPRHEMLKIKSTFVKMHGHGSMLVLTMPDFERQGGNLTVECVMRALEYGFESSGQPSIRNVYIQLDNVYTNKCRTVFSVMTALVILGICAKVKISFLEVGHTHEV